MPWPWCALLKLRRPETDRKAKLPRVALPRDAVIYAIGDVHGMLDPLLAIEEKVLADGARFAERKIVVMLGDYVDRGRHSAKVIDHLMAPMPAGFHRLCLRGNHEQAMLAFLRDPLAHRGWLDMGGDATMDSYGIDVRPLIRGGSGRAGELSALLGEVVPDEHRRFLEGLPVLAVGGKIAYAHAGIRPGIPLAEQEDRDLLWIREPFLSDGPQLPLIVVHGHTPSIDPVRIGNRIGIDTFAYSTGRLIALRVRGDRGAFLQAA